MKIIALIGLVFSLLSITEQTQAGEETLLLRSPTASATHLAFVYAGDIWTSDLNGNNPRRITVHPGVEQDPFFSPDGSQIAFTGWYGGNYDVYVIPVEGGEPRRLTWHPAPDVSRGWTPDGKRVLFTSTRKAIKPSKQFRLWTIDAKGGFPDVLPMPVAFRGAYSPDSTRIAYTPIKDPPFGGWKRYRGGMTPPIWIFDFATHQVEKIPHHRTNDRDPLWVGDQLYFISDRDRIANIYRYDSGTKAVTRVTAHEDFDVLNATASPLGIVYEQAGRIHQLNPHTGESKPVSVAIAADHPHARPRWQSVVKQIESVGFSTDGSQLAIGARGDIHVLAASSGHSQNLSHSSDSHQRHPAWSPDGKKLAWVSDHSGEYQLVIYSLDEGSETIVRLDENPSFYFQLQWSPDGNKLLLVDKRNQLLVVETTSGLVSVVDRDSLSTLPLTLNPRFSPDGRYLAYTKNLDTHMRALYLHDLKFGRTYQATDEMADITSPVWGRDGRILYFAASTNYGPRTSWLSIGNIGYQPSSSLYAMSLQKNAESPLPFKARAGEISLPKDTVGPDSTAPSIDFVSLQQRVTPLPIEPGNYGHLEVAADGSLLLLKFHPGDFPVDRAPGKPRTLLRFDFDSLQAEPIVAEIDGYRLSGDGQKLLLRKGADLSTAELSSVENSQPIALSNMRAYINPRQEWRQMYFEAWRVLREYFYADNMHGLDSSKIRDRYAPFLDHLNHRADLDYLLKEMQGELVVGHAYIKSGDQPGQEQVPVGLLGVDLEVQKGKYRIQKIYSGERWNPDFEAPLDRVGQGINVGDYIHGIDGQDLDQDINIYQLLIQTVGRDTTLLVADNAQGKNRRTVQVTPVDYGQETRLRLRDWVEGNRRKVDEMTNGKVAYVHMPDTGQWGHAYFYRYYYSQWTKQAAIIDDRFNDGGKVSDDIVNRMAAPLLSYWAVRDGGIVSSPANIFGPKVMLINETSGSGGDALPLFFRRQGVGKLIGKRTWGGLVGIGYYPPLLDGGSITAPHFAIVSPEGDWEVENAGVPPDIDVEKTPMLVIEGHDPQLEKAVEVVLEQLQHSAFKRLHQPPEYPNRALE